jgi:hypothetical protein
MSGKGKEMINRLIDRSTYIPRDRKGLVRSILSEFDISEKDKLRLQKKVSDAMYKPEVAKIFAEMVKLDPAVLEFMQKHSESIYNMLSSGDEEKVETFLNDFIKDMNEIDIEDLKKLMRLERHLARSL